MGTAASSRLHSIFATATVQPPPPHPPPSHQHHPVRAPTHSLPAPSNACYLLTACRCTHAHIRCPHRHSPSSSMPTRQAFTTHTHLSCSWSPLMTFAYYLHLIWQEQQLYILHVLWHSLLCERSKTLNTAMQPAPPHHEQTAIHTQSVGKRDKAAGIEALLFLAALMPALCVLVGRTSPLVRRRPRNCMHHSACRCRALTTP